MTTLLEYGIFEGMRFINAEILNTKILGIVHLFMLVLNSLSIAKSSL